jgi:hypothetical protein
MAGGQASILQVGSVIGRGRRLVQINVGNADRAIRVVVGLVLLSLFFFLEGTGRYWGLVGILPLATGLFRFCPAYALFGINSCPTA